MISEEKLLDAAKDIAWQFISLEASQELPYFAVLWRHVKSLRQDGLDRKRPKWRPWAEGIQRLAFAEGKTMDLFSPFVLVGVLAALDELNAEVTVPNRATLEKGISAFAKAMGTPEPKAEKVARSLAPVILERWTDLQKQTDEERVPPEAHLNRSRPDVGPLEQAHAEVKVGDDAEIMLAEAAQRFDVPLPKLSKAWKLPANDLNRLPARKVGRTVLVKVKDAKRWADNYLARQEVRRMAEQKDGAKLTVREALERIRRMT